MAEPRDAYMQDVRDQGRDDEALLRVARDRFDRVVEAESEWRREAMHDLRFLAGEQWDSYDYRQRQLERRPALVINRLPSFKNQIVNEQRQNPAAIRVSPVDDKADKDTAKVLQGIIRHIEVASGADTAYATAFESAVTHGKGWVRVLTEYETPMSFSQRILIQRVRNPFCVYADPGAKEFDYSDMQWAFIVESMSRDAFMNAYPQIDKRQYDAWTATGDAWVQRDAVRVAEYFYLEHRRRKIVRLLDDSVILKDEVTRGTPIVEERETMIPTVYWCKICGHEVLERTQWLGKWIPLIPVLGDEMDIDNKLMYAGIIRHAKDPQRMYNYWASSETETIALAPKAPYIGAEGQFENHPEWKTANIRNHAYLQYKPVSIGGTLAPPPQRNVQEPPVAAITQARLLAADDLKATTGIYDASLGNRSNETSGRAIQSRQQESDTANYHYPDNLRRAIRHLGRVLVDLIPRVYDQPRVMRIIGEDDTEQVVSVNQPFQPQPGIERIYDLTVGTYDVVTSLGPSFATKRQEAAQNMLDLTQAFPKLGEVAGDLVVKNMDWPGAQEISTRLRKTLPPGLLEDESGMSAEDQLAQVQAMLQQTSQQLEALNQYAQQAEQQAQQLQQENEMLKSQMALKEQELVLKSRELDLKIRIEEEKLAIERERIDLEVLRLRRETEIAAASSVTDAPDELSE